MKSGEDVMAHLRRLLAMDLTVSDGLQRVQPMPSYFASSFCIRFTPT